MVMAAKILSFLPCQSFKLEEIILLKPQMSAEDKASFRIKQGRLKAKRDVRERQEGIESSFLECHV